MAQHDYTIANQTFPATRTDLNNALAATVTQNSGATAPTTTYAYQLWYDTTADKLKQRNANDDAWIDLFDVDQVADTAAPSTGAGGGGAILQVKYTIYDTASSIATNANTTTTLTNLQVDITPSATNSIIRLDAMVNGEFNSYGYNFNSTWFFLRDSTKLSAPAAGSRTTGVRIGTSASFSSDSSSTPDGSYFTYFDSDHSTTSAITYSVGVNTHTAGTWYENRTVSDSNTFEFERGISFICATEIAG